MATHRKRRRRLQQHTRRNGKEQPPPEGVIVLLPASGACSQCGRNTLSSQPAPRTPTYILPTPITPSTHHSRGFALVHLLIVEITLIILLVLGCCTLVMPKVRMVLEEWHKLQTSSNSNAFFSPTKNDELSASTLQSPNSVTQLPTTAQNTNTSNGSERKEGRKKHVLKRRRGKRSGLC